MAVDNDPDDSENNDNVRFIDKVLPIIVKAFSGIISQGNELNLNFWQRFWPGASGCFLSLGCQVSYMFLSWDQYRVSFELLSQQDWDRMFPEAILLFMAAFTALVGLVIACDHKTHRIKRFFFGILIPPFILAVTKTTSFLS